MILLNKYDFDNYLIRKPTNKDAESIYVSYAQDKEVTKYLSWTAHKTLGDTQKFMSYALNQWDKKVEFHFVICLNHTNKPIGMMSINPNKHIIRIGYVLGKQYWGKGIMSKLVKNFSDLLLEQDDIFRVEAICDIENIGSKRVLEKSGFQIEGILRKYILHPGISELPRDVYILSKIH